MEFQIDPDLLRISHLMTRSCFINVLLPLFFYITGEKIGQDVLRNFVFDEKIKIKGELNGFYQLAISERLVQLLMSFYKLNCSLS